MFLTHILQSLHFSRCFLYTPLVVLLLLLFFYLGALVQLFANANILYLKYQLRLFRHIFIYDLLKIKMSIRMGFLVTLTLVGIKQAALSTSLTADLLRIFQKKKNQGSSSSLGNWVKRPCWGQRRMTRMLQADGKPNNSNNHSLQPTEPKADGL